MKREEKTVVAVWKASTDIIAIAANADIHVEDAKIRVVNDVDTYREVDEYVGAVVSDLKKMMAYKELATRGLKNDYDTRMKFFNPIIAKLKGVKADLLGKQQKWNKRQEDVAKAAQAEADKAARELAAKGIEVHSPVITKATPMGNTKYRDKWVGEVVDLPKLVEYIVTHQSDGMEFLMPDQREINLAADKERVEGEFLPGLNFTNKRIPIS